MRRIATLVLCGSLALLGCRLRGAQVEQSPLLRIFERASGLIAYVGGDGNIRVIDQKGGRAAAITNDADMGPGAAVAYGLPTWSPDGGHLAYPGYRSDPDRTSLTTWIGVSDRTGRETRMLHTTTELSPIYLSWSPDSALVAILSSVIVAGGLELGVAPSTSEMEYRVLDHGQPYYWDWLPDSSTLVTHVGESRMSFLPAARSGRGGTLPTSAAAFQSPDVSPDGLSLAYLRPESEGYTVVVRRLDSGEERSIARDPRPAYFSFSGDSSRLAILHADGVSPLPHGRLTVVTLGPGEAAESVTLAEELALAFFWSPRGDRLVGLMVSQDPSTTDGMFELSSERLYVMLQGFEPARGRSWTIAQYPVTVGTLQILPFFDQYHHSITVWSPDGRTIVFTAYTADGSPGVHVVPADGNLKPRRVAEGDSATWSPK